MAPNLNGFGDVLSREEYEDVYRETLLCLRQIGRIVGTPFADVSGTRLCPVDGQLLPDPAIFQLWWGSEIARHIMSSYRP